MCSAEGETWCGGWRRWQLRLAALLALPVLLTGAYTTNYVFLAAYTPFRCRVPECEGAEGPAELAPPWAAWALGPQPCWRPRPLDGACQPHSFDNATLLPCQEFVYGPGSSSSIVAELGLACREVRRSLVGTAHNAGMLLSLPIMGYVSDRWGRRAALVGSAVGVGVVGVGKSFVTSYGAYLAAELLETVFGASVYPAAFVLMIEWLDAEHRIQTSLVLGVPLALGAAALALLDYLAGSWRLWARLAYPPSLLLLAYPWLLPESVRWLLARGRTSDAVEVIRCAASWNKLQLSQDALDKVLIQQKQQAEAKQEDEEGLLRALIKYGSLRVRLSVCFVWWFSGVFVFYGLAVNARALAGGAGGGWGPHVTYAALGAAQLPALVANTLLLDRLGRRRLLAAALLLTAAALLLSSHRATDEGGGGGGWAGSVLYLVGQAGATMTLNALYVYTAELFPTSARQRLLAASSTAGRLGALLAPLTPLLAGYGAWVPRALCGVLPLLSAALTLLVPETLHRPLPACFADLQDPPAQPAPAPAPAIATIS